MLLNTKYNSLGIVQNLNFKFMSLDVYLTRKKWVSFDEGKTFTEEMEDLYCDNITHNLNTMAEKAGIYEAL